LDYYILTNNKLVLETYSKTHNVRFVECGLKEILSTAGKFIEDGDILLTHPMYGSVKPNETPYRSMLLQPAGRNPGSGFPPIDFESARLVQSAIEATEKFLFKKEFTDPQLIDDLQVVDLSLLSSAIASADM